MTFNEFVQTHATRNKLLPLVHTTDVNALDEIISKCDSTLKPRHCSVFKEDLLYFFYGRPAYRVNADMQSNKIVEFNPVCFVFKINKKTPTPVRIYPFDSGAFQHPTIKTEFGKHINIEMQLDDFSLCCNLNNTPRKFVTAFFGDNDKYFNEQVRTKLRNTISCLEAVCYHNLAKDVNESPLDNRRYTLEVQCNAPPKTAIEKRNRKKTSLYDKVNVERDKKPNHQRGVI